MGVGRTEVWGAEKHEWSEVTRGYDWDLYKARKTFLEVCSALGQVPSLPGTQSLYMCTEKVGLDDTQATSPGHLCCPFLPDTVGVTRFSLVLPQALEIHLDACIVGAGPSLPFIIMPLRARREKKKKKEAKGSGGTGWRSGLMEI